LLHEEYEARKKVMLNKIRGQKRSTVHRAQDDGNLKVPGSVNIEGIIPNAVARYANKV